MKYPLLCLLVSGCAVGGSSSMVGRWRARRIIDSTACVQTQAPGAACEKLISIGRDLPARKFSSLMFTFPATGYVQRREGGDVGHGVLFDSYFEYVRGRGMFAIGGRVGAEVGNGFGKKILFSTPVTLIAHAGGLWGSVYVGAGYSPIATESLAGEMPPPETWYHDSVHAVAGTRFWMSRTLERGLSFNPELRVQTFGDSTLVSLSGNIGLHF